MNGETQPLASNNVPFWRLLKPQDVVPVVWLLLTLPIVFVDVAALWGPLLDRIIFIPLYFLVRPYAFRVGTALHSDEAAGHTITRGRRLWWWAVQAAATLLPWVMYPMGYSEMGKFISVIHAGFGCTNDIAIQDIEEELFGGQPSVTWRGTSSGAGYLLFDEYLQFCYFGLYIIVAGVPFLYWLNARSRARTIGLTSDGGSVAGVGSAPPSSSPTSATASGSETVVAVDESAGDRAGGFTPSSVPRQGYCDRQRFKNDQWPYYAFDVVLTALLVVSMFCWIIYFIYPVSGPLWCFTRPDSSLTGYFFSYVNAYVQNAGASHGTATPSSHAASTVCIWILTFIFWRKLAWWMTLIVPGLVWGTFWLQYHYLFDAITGTMIGCAFPWISIAIHDWIAGQLNGPGWPTGSPGIKQPPTKQAAQVTAQQHAAAEARGETRLLSGDSSPPSTTKESLPSSSSSASDTDPIVPPVSASASAEV